MKEKPSNTFLAFLLLCTFIGSCLQQTMAQTPMKWEDFVENMTDEYQENDIEPSTFEDLYEIYLHPINLNNTTYDELRQLPFLTDIQINAILYHVLTNYPMRSLGELMLISSIDYTTRMRLMLFCRAGEERPVTTAETLRNILRYPKQDVTLRTDIPFYTKEGYRDYPDSILSRYPNRVYQGNNNYHSLRYAFNAKGHILAGLEVEKDGGEREFDYVSAYVMLHDIGRIRNLVIGDYKLSFGQGLVVSNSMSFGKHATLGSMPYMGRGISRHSSMMESNHLRGIAANLTLSQRVHATAFASYQGIDATLSGSNSNSVSSLKTDGLHRTQLERSKRNLLHEFTWGGNLQFSQGVFSAGVTAIATHLSMPLTPKHDTPSSAYRLYNLHGTDFGAIGLSYGYITSKYSFQGETAMSTASGCMATINTMSMRTSSTTTLSMSVRHFNKAYATRYGHTLSESSTPQNETGILAAIKAEPWQRIHIEAYADVFHFPYMRSNTSAASNGLDCMAQVVYTPTDKSRLQLRYRIKSKQQDYADGNGGTQLMYGTNQTWRLSYTQQIGSPLSLQTLFTFSHRFNPDSDNESGLLLAENVRWQSSDGGRHVSLMAAYFNTDSYASRVWTYEPSLLYSLGMNSFFYHGLRVAVVASANVSKSLRLQCKLGHTSYFGRNTIGTGLEQISQSHREDLLLQARWTF